MKTRDVRINGVRTFVSRNKQTGVVTGSTSFPQQLQDALSVVTDTTTGDFRSPNPHEFSKRVRRSYRGFEIREDTTFLDRWDGVSGVPPDPDLSPISSTVLYNSALAQMLDDLRSGGVGSGLDLAVDVAERRQVAKLLRQVGNLTDYIRSFHPRHWASKWLEYQYGWRPMVNSIYGTFDALMYRRSYTYARWKGKSNLKADSGRVVMDQRWPNSREALQQRLRARYLIVSEYKHSPSVQASLLGYTTLNPAVLAWELMPYSFVIDWFVDIGGYLRSMEASLAFKQQFVRGFTVYGYLATQSGSITGQSGSVAQNNYRFGVYSEGYVQLSYKKRAVLSVAPTPRIPSFSANLGWQRLLSSAALLRQHLNRS